VQGDAARWPVSKRVISSKADADDVMLIDKVDLAARLTAQKHNGRAEARPLRSQALLSSLEPRSHRPRCIADSGFDTQSDLLLAMLTFP